MVIRQLERQLEKRRALALYAARLVEAAVAARDQEEAAVALAVDSDLVGRHRRALLVIVGLLDLCDPEAQLEAVEQHAAIGRVAHGRAARGRGLPERVSVERLAVADQR